MTRALWFLLIGCLVAAPASGEDAAPVPGCPGGFTTRLVPLPVYATLPNEGDTFGAMPVFIRVCDANQRTDSIVAPSVTWNDVIHWTGTLRWFHYPSDEQALTFILSASTRINYGVLLQWRDLPRRDGAFTSELELRWQRSAFYRFFGLGPDTPETAETSYTRVRAHANARRGLNIGSGWNVGLGALLHRDLVQDLGVPGLPLSRQVFADKPGMAGSTILGQAVDIRFDSRPNFENSERGIFASAGIALVEGLARSPTFVQGQARFRVLVPEASWLGGAARVDWTYVSTPNAPFYDQSTLGGAYLLRGFTEDRFIDQSSWTIEFEERIQLFQTHIYGVTADWRVDPFIALGQVYGSTRHAFSNPQLAGGVGFRAWVRPNVLGRIDVASGGEGIKVYVEIGYPY